MNSYWSEISQKFWRDKTLNNFNFGFFHKDKRIEQILPKESEDDINLTIVQGEKPLDQTEYQFIRNQNTYYSNKDLDFQAINCFANSKDCELDRSHISKLINNLNEKETMTQVEMEGKESHDFFDQKYSDQKCCQQNIQLRESGYQNYLKRSIKGRVNEELDEQFEIIGLQKRKILFVGMAGVGKTKLFNQFNFRKQKNQIFKEGIIYNEQLQIKFVDTPSFDMENSIDQRNTTILLFQDYFLRNMSSISILAILVNFERTDLMKVKINLVNKYLKNIFKEQIIIIVTEWEKSDSENDQIHLEEKLNYLGYKILFVKNDGNQERLIETFSEIAKNFPNRTIDLRNSMFEISGDDDDEMTKQMCERIEQQFRKNKFETLGSWLQNFFLYYYDLSLNLQKKTNFYYNLSNWKPKLYQIFQYMKKMNIFH